MRILIVCVNYNSYEELDSFLKSVDMSASILKEGSEIDVIIADNSTDRRQIDLKKYSFLCLQQKYLDNYGYLGGAQTVINDIKDIIKYDYVIISNVDVTFGRESLNELNTLKLDENTAWIAPCIYSEKYNKDLNPNLLVRYKKWHLRVLRFIYRKYIYYLYVKFYHSRKKSIETTYNTGHEIYAGHGSCMILTSNFFKCYRHINYPVFLYGEEIYLAELIMKKNMRVKYVPDIKIKTTGGVSTSKMPSEKFFKYNIEALDYILNNFY